MSASAVYLQPAFILQHRPYRETSLLLEVFTRDYGIIPVLAKGVRKEKSRLAGVLLPFTLLRISYLDKNELKTLTEAEFVCNFPLQRLGLYCGFYVNELLQVFLHKHDPHSELFQCYQACLADLHANQAIEQTLRYFELSVLEESGYGAEIDVEQDSKVSERYDFFPGLGLVVASNGCVSHDTLQLLACKSPLSGSALPEAKLLLRKMLDEHLQGKPLKSRDVLAKIIKYL
ncbi:MAG: DNA repair protein RecO [Methylomonas sp.]|nr:MAG: DNA repair protein RecO [Methylomonas sp.]